MSGNTAIEWTDATWNPVTGCTKVSPGCDHCYAETFAERWRGIPGHYFARGFDVQVRADKVNLPLTWRKPKRVFVNSMSDLFHADVAPAWIADIFAVMAAAGRHTFQVLTKRHARMRTLLSDAQWVEQVRSRTVGKGLPDDNWQWPLPNVWLGVSVENQKWADIRIPALLGTPAAVRFISAEPLLGPVDLHDVAGIDALERDWAGSEAGGTGAPHPFLDWVIVGGESGPGARPMHPNWARSLRDQCHDAGVPFFFKQWGNWRPQPMYCTDDRHHVVMPDGRDRGTPWPGWGIDQPDAAVMQRVGKKDAGRELDGRTWNEYPAVTP